MGGLLLCTRGHAVLVEVEYKENSRYLSTHGPQCHYPTVQSLGVVLDSLLSPCLSCTIDTSYQSDSLSSDVMSITVISFVVTRWW